MYFVALCLWSKPFSLQSKGKKNSNSQQDIAVSEGQRGVAPLQEGAGSPHEAPAADPAFQDLQLL